MGLACQGSPVKLKHNGQDSQYNIAIDLGNYADFNPEFGVFGDCHWGEENGIIRVLFHPRRKYEKGELSDMYWCYVGVAAPPIGACSGLPDLVDVTDIQINFKGKLRFAAGGEFLRTTTMFGGRYMYSNEGYTKNVECAFNNVGYENKPLSQAHLVESGPNFYNLYWGDWWKSEYGEGMTNWIDFDVNMTAASQVAYAKGGQQWPTDHIRLYYIAAGPEFPVNGMLVFDVKDLELISVPQ